MTDATFQCSIVTPERVVLECEAQFVAFPAHDGEMGILRNRAPLVCRLGVGQLRIQGAPGSGESHTLVVDGGFAQVLDNRLTILTEQALTPGDIDADTARQWLVEAQAMKVTDDASLAARDRAVARAKLQLRLSPPQ